MCDFKIRIYTMLKAEIEELTPVVEESDEDEIDYERFSVTLWSSTPISVPRATSPKVSSKPLSRKSRYQRIASGGIFVATSAVTLPLI